MAEPKRAGESWGTRVGVILAVMGSAVGLGNFLRFPGKAAQYEGGAFMIPYFIALFLLGLPIAWAEWAMGRHGGSKGFNSIPGIFRVIWKNKFSPYLGALGLLIPVAIYMYYVYIEAWCLGYACKFLAGRMALGKEASAYTDHFDQFIGKTGNGDAFKFGDGQSFFGSAVFFLIVCFAINFLLIYRGLTKGIEWFCKWAMPALAICAIIVLVRVLTLGTPNPNLPRQNVINGLGFMWNPEVDPHWMAGEDPSLRGLIVAYHLATNPPAMTPADVAAGGWTAGDANAWASALAASGWKKQKPGWVHGDSKLTLTRSDAGVVAVTADADQDPSALAKDDKALLGLTRAYHLVLNPPSIDGGQIEDKGWTVADARAWEKATEAAGWKQRRDGRWGIEGSRLRVSLDGQSRVQLHAKTFWESMTNAQMWLEAAGQIFFSLSVGFGIIVCYASYLRRDDDIALSGLTASAGNEFCEVALGGLITIPAAFIFLGGAGVGGGTFGLGFMTLPNVFFAMPAGRWVGALFFFLLFLAAVTSSLSMLQPAIALLEEGLGLGRKASVSILGFITAVGSGFVVYFSEGNAALDTMDFWVGTVAIYILAMVEVVLFAWVLGIDKGYEELKRGAEIGIPKVVMYIIKYVSPVYLMVIFVVWVYQQITAEKDNYFKALGHSTVAQLSVALIIAVTVLFLLLIGQSVKRWAKAEAAAEGSNP